LYILVGPLQKGGKSVSSQFSTCLRLPHPGGKWDYCGRICQLLNRLHEACCLQHCSRYPAILRRVCLSRTNAVGVTCRVCCQCQQLLSSITAQWIGKSVLKRVQHTYPPNVGRQLDHSIVYTRAGCPVLARRPVLACWRHIQCSRQTLVDRCRKNSIRSPQFTSKWTFVKNTAAAFPIFSYMQYSHHKLAPKYVSFKLHISPSASASINETFYTARHTVRLAILNWIDI